MIFFRFLLILVGFPLFGATYFVSFSAPGADGNSGLDTAHPWKTITKVNGFTYANGDIIKFNCGDTWPGIKLTPHNAGITFTQYGSCVGVYPILDGTGTLSPIVQMNQNNITIDGLEFTRPSSGGAMVDFCCTTGGHITNSYFLDGGWFSIQARTNSVVTITVDHNICIASPGHIQTGGCVLIESPGTPNIHHNLVDYRNLDKVNSGPNVIGIEVGASSTAHLDHNSVYGAGQGVTIKPGSCPTGGTPGVGTCYTHKVTGGTMNYNYLWGIERYGNNTPILSPNPGSGCTVNGQGDGEAIEMEGHATPYPQLNVEVAYNIIIGKEAINGNEGWHTCAGGTADASGTFYSSDDFHDNIIIGPCGTYNCFHFGAVDSASIVPTRFYNNVFYQGTNNPITGAPIVRRTHTAFNNLAAASGTAGGNFRNNIIKGFAIGFNGTNLNGTTEDYDILDPNVSIQSTGTTIGVHTRVIDPLFINTPAGFTPNDLKLQPASPANATGLALLPFNLILSPNQSINPTVGTLMPDLVTIDQSAGWMRGAFGFLNVAPVISGPNIAVPHGRARQSRF